MFSAPSGRRISPPFHRRRRPAFGIILPEEGQEEAPEEIRTLADQRWQAKQNRDWTEADRLRAEVAALGWVIKDRKDGYDLARK